MNRRAYSGWVTSTTPKGSAKERKEVESKFADMGYLWTFDLTSFNFTAGPMKLFSLKSGSK